MGFIHEHLPNENDNDNEIYHYDETVDNLQDDECCCPCIPKRYMVAILSFLGFANIHALRVNFSVAIVAMVTNRTSILPNGTECVVTPADFNWDPELQGFLLSSFFYGCVISQIPSGYFASKYGGKYLFGSGVLLPSLLTLITPHIASISPYLLTVLRVLEGLFEGATFPSMHEIWSKWAPPLERSRLVTISLSGMFVGTVLAMSVSGVVADYLGWRWIFYISGAVGVVWSLFWFALVTDEPKDQMKITKKELKYILSGLRDINTDRQVIATPWKEFFTSLPVWSIIIAQMANHWGYYLFLTQLPTYTERILKFTLEEASFISSLPFFATAVISQCGGQLCDLLRSRGTLTTTAVRKLFNSVGFLSQTVFLVVVGYNSNQLVATVALTLASGLGSLAWSGFSVNYFDIAPRYAGILFGISNCLATFSGIICPLVVGVLTTNESHEEWRTVFLISAGIFAFAMVFYAVFASGEKQPWADGEDGLNTENEEENKFLISGDHGH